MTVPSVGGRLADNVAKGSAWTILSLSINLPLGFVANVLVARELGPAEFGRYASLAVIIGLVSVVADFGLSAAQQQFGTRFVVAGDAEALDRLFAAVQTVRLVVVVPVNVLVSALLLGGNSVQLLGAYLVAVLLANVLMGVPLLLQCRNETSPGARGSLVASVFASIAAVLAARMGGTGDAVFMARGLFAAIVPLWLFLRLTGRDRQLVLRLGSPRGLPRGIWSFGLPAWAAGLLGALVYSRVEVVVLRFLGQADAAGLYAMAYGLAQQATSPLDSLASILGGATTATVARSRAASVRLIHRACSLFSLVLAPILLIGAVGPVLIPVLFGSEYRGAGLMFVALLVASATQTLWHPLHAFALAERRSLFLLCGNLLALVIDVALLFLISDWGAWGAVVAKVAAQGTALLLVSVLVVRLAPLSVSSWAASVLPFVVAVGFMIPVSFVGWLVSGAVTVEGGAVSPWGLIGVAVTLLLCLLGWGGTVRALSLVKDVQSILDLLERLPRRAARSCCRFVTLVAGVQMRE